MGDRKILLLSLEEKYDQREREREKETALLHFYL